jgi:hypothetical protein
VLLCDTASLPSLKAVLNKFRFVAAYHRLIG